MADVTPFERLFNPPSPGQEGSLFGSIGAAMGNKSTFERAQEANAEALADLSARVQAGATPQKALLDFMQTPQGMEVIRRGGVQDLGAQWMKTISETPNVQAIPPGHAPAVTVPGQRGVDIRAPIPTTEQQTATTVPSGQVVPPGSGFMQRGAGASGFSPTFTQPTAAAQDFQSLARIAQLPPEVLGQIAHLQLLPADQRDSEARRIANEAVKAGVISRGDANLLAMGAFGPNGFYTITPVRNIHGEEVGRALIDKRNPTAPVILPQQRATDMPGSPATMAPPAGSPAAAVEQGHKDLAKPTNKATMFLGAGVLPAVAQRLGQAMRQMNPEWTNETTENADNNRRNLTILQTAAIQLSRTGEGLNVPAPLIAAARELAPGATLWQDPKSALTHAIDAYAQTTRAIERDELKRRDVNVSHPEKIAAEKRIASYQNFLDAMPTLEQMTALQKVWARDPGAGVIAPSAIKGVGQEATTGATQAATDTLNGKKTPPVQAKPGRFNKMGDEEFLKVDPMRLPPGARGEYRKELQRRRELLQQRK